VIRSLNVYIEKLKQNKKGSKPSKEVLPGSNKSSPKKDVPGDTSGVLPSHGTKLDAHASKDQPGTSSADEILFNEDGPIPEQKGICIGMSFYGRMS